MVAIKKEELYAFDDALAMSVVGYDYYPDKPALAAYARATRTRLPLTGDAYLAFKDSDRYKRDYRELSPEERCSLILADWNNQYPDRFVVDPFLDGAK